MATNLVIVESAGKVASITKYLNNNPALKKYGKFIVVASFGHIRDLAKKTLAIDLNTFEPQYEFLQDKKKQLDKIKEAARSAKNVYLAADADQEGHFIAESVRVFLNLGENYKRIVFTEITSAALEHAIKNPGKIDPNQIAGQQCRRILDRLVGFKLSPLLWKKFKSGGAVTLSAGRVQSAVMHMIIQREKEILNFTSGSYWHMHANFALKIDTSITELNEIKLYKDTNLYKTEKVEDVKAFFLQLKNKWSVESYKQKTTKSSPDAPFITSTLQQEASSKLRIGVKRVMAIAQELYEDGYITYMRTDSYNMSETFKEPATEYIKTTFGQQYVSQNIKTSKKNKGAQEAHECIRPTDVKETSLPPQNKYTQDHRDLYKLIWRRAVAYLMAPAIYDELALNLKDIAMKKDMMFKATFKKVNFNGYLLVYDVKNETNNFKMYTEALDKNKYELTCSTIQAKNTWQSPPARYNDTSLIKLMETTGIGRPSTYSTILDKLYDKNYVVKTDIQGVEKPKTDYSFDPKTKKIKSETGVAKVGAEQGRAKPTDIGFKVDEYLTQYFDYIVDKEFTAHMEADLDLISSGKKKRNDVLVAFWKRLSGDIDSQMAIKEAKKIVETEKRVVKIGDREFTVRMGPYGPLVEYLKDGKKTFIGLKGYLQMAKKEYSDIDENDIKFLLSIPLKLGKVDGKDAMLVSGPYGFYIKWNDRNVKIPAFAIKKFGQTRTFTQEELKGFIEYKPRPRSAPSPLK